MSSTFGLVGHWNSSFFFLVGGTRMYCLCIGQSKGAVVLKENWLSVTSLQSWFNTRGIFFDYQKSLKQSIAAITPNSTGNRTKLSFNGAFSQPRRCSTYNSCSLQLELTRVTVKRMRDELSPTHSIHTASLSFSTAGFPSI